MEQQQARDRAEARRRKLLMSAEDRLKRIVGTNKEPDVKADGTHSSVGYEEVVKRLSESEEVLFDSNQPSKSFSDSAEHSHSWLTEKLLSAAFQPELPLKPENETTVSQSKLTDNGTHIKAADNKLSDKSTETLRLLNVFFKTKLVVSLLLGFIVRFCQTTVFGQTYIQSLCYPFVALEVIFIGCQQTFELDPGQAAANSMWMTMLRFAGMRPEVLSTYKTIMTTVSGISDDFAVYFLTYMIAHTVLSVT